MSKRRRRGGDEQRRLVREWESTGERASEFASRVGVSAQSLYRWRAAATRTKVPAAALSRIVEVRTAMPADARFELEGRGWRVRVPACFDEASLRRLLQVLEGPS